MNDQEISVEEADDFDDFAEDDQDVATTHVEPKEGGIHVGIDFPKDTDTSTIDKVLSTVGKMTADHMEVDGKFEESKEKYRKEGHRRYKCIVESRRADYPYFELIIPHPTKDVPVKVEGHCGVLLEAGLTMYAINALKQSYTMRTVKRTKVNRDDNTMGLEYRSVKVFNYSIEIFEEVVNPSPIGAV